MQNQIIADKISGREKAIQLLEAQLVVGTKPAKGEKPYDGTKTDKQGRRIKLNIVPLSIADRRRIRIQIENLHRKIDRKNIQVLMSRKQSLEGAEMEYQPIWSDKPKVKHARPKNPKTKLYRLMDGIYCKIKG